MVTFIICNGLIFSENVSFNKPIGLKEPNYINKGSFLITLVLLTLVVFLFNFVGSKVKLIYFVISFLIITSFISVEFEF